MARKNFTLKDVEIYLEELGFTWQGRLIYDQNTRKYKTAKLTSFNKDVFMLLKRLNRDCLMLATINNETFELRGESNKLYASDGWVETLEAKNKGEINEI